ncbi:MAG: ABC transporter substrate-binding protein [Chloroflexi bacterium]|nr:ABC transporter substrate-binding protein [Chloroflexota bacterium]
MRNCVLFAATVLLTLALGISCSPGAEPTATPVPTATPTPLTVGLPTITAPATPTRDAVVATPTAAPTATATPVPTVQPQRGGIIIQYGSGDPRTLDINQETSVLPLGYATGIYNTLVRIDSERLPAERVIIGEAAESWTVNENSTVFTFKLHKGITFHDGKPLTSADVKATIERLKTPPQGVISPLSTQFRTVAGVDTPDELTVVIRTSAPTGYMMAQLALPTSSIAPKHIVDVDQKALEKKPVGSGPFVFKEWNKGVDIKLSRNDSYWAQGTEKLPYLDGIQVLVIPENAQQVAALRTGRVHMTGFGGRGLSEDEAKQVAQTNPEIRIIQYKSTTTGPVQLNMTQPPFNDFKVRKAISLVWDQTKLLQLSGAGELGDFTGGISLTWALDKSYLLQFPMYRGVKAEDIAQAKALLAEAGYSTPLELEYLIADRYLVGSERNMGVLSDSGLFKLTGKVVTYPAPWTDITRQLNYKITSGSIIKPLYDPTSQLSTYVAGDPENRVGLNDPQLESLFQQIGSAADFAVRKKLTDQFQKRLFEEIIPGFPASSGYQHNAFRPEVRGWTHHGILRDNFHFERVWLAK